MNAVTQKLIKFFKGTLVGSTAAKENGVQVDPHDIDITFATPEKMAMATVFLESEGYKQEMIRVPGGYMRSDQMVWKGRMYKIGEVSIDLFCNSKNEVGNVSGVATNMEVLIAHLERVKTGDKPLNREYIERLVSSLPN